MTMPEMVSSTQDAAFRQSCLTARTFNQRVELEHMRLSMMQLTTASRTKPTQAPGRCDERTTCVLRTMCTVTLPSPRRVRSFARTVVSGPEFYAVTSMPGRADVEEEGSERGRSCRHLRVQAFPTGHALKLARQQPNDHVLANLRRRHLFVFYSSSAYAFLQCLSASLNRRWPSLCRVSRPLSGAAVYPYDGNAATNVPAHAHM